MSMDLPIFFEDELRPSPAECLAFQRLSAQCRSSRGWIIGERFDERYDTEVGGVATVVMQWIAESGDITSDWKRTADGEIETVCHPSVIVDYSDHGRRITPEEADGQPELAGVLARLREREAAYAALVARQVEADRISKLRDTVKKAELRKRGRRFLPAQVLRAAYAAAGAPVI